MNSEIHQPEGSYRKIGPFHFPTNREGMEQVLFGKTFKDSWERAGTSGELFLAGMILSQSNNLAVQSFGVVLFYAGLPSGVIQSVVAYNRRENEWIAKRKAESEAKEEAIINLKNQVRELSQPFLEESCEHVTLYESNKRVLPGTAVNRVLLSSNRLAQGEQFLRLFIEEFPEVRSDSDPVTIIYFSFPQVELLEVRSTVKERNKGDLKVLKFAIDVLNKVKELPNDTNNA